MKLRRTIIVGSKKMLVFDDMQATEKIWIYDRGVEPAEALGYGEDLRLRFGDITLPLGVRRAMPQTRAAASRLHGKT